MVLSARSFPAQYELVLLFREVVVFMLDAVGCRGFDNGIFDDFDRIGDMERLSEGGAYPRATMDEDILAQVGCFINCFLVMASMLFKKL